MRILLQKELNTKESLYDAELSLAPSVGMCLPLGISMDEVCQFVTRKRAASGIDPSCALNKGRAANAPAIDAPSVAPSRCLGGSAIFDPQLAGNLVHAILLLTDRELRRRRTLNEMFGLFYPTLIGESKAPYWIDFGDDQDAIQQLFPNLDLSSIVIPSAEEGGDGVEEEEEGGGDGSPVDPADDGAPITILALTELAISVVSMVPIEDVLSSSMPTSLTFQLVVEVPSEKEEATPTKVIPPTDAALPIEAEVVPDQPSEQSVIE
ncbi:hypothetical protein COCNU_07G010750 [Cocos nucifera]|uniref:Uncharacterized protein n=1 Tax=Cocos nucifera TaxID=13894 RepID=A0A8K0N534_COCNU|nr:hypothetical protein COCNU_07G010750 [Cocos nucifera]